MSASWRWGCVAVAMGAGLVAISQGAGCGGKVILDDVTSTDDASHDDGASSAATCSAAASVDGDGNGCTCGVDSCGRCSSCAPCDVSSQCSAGFVCIHHDGECGAGEKGECVAEVNHGCPLLPRSCTCEGMVQVVCSPTIDVSIHPESCSHGTFFCGPDLACKDYVEYCSASQTGPPDGSPPHYECAPAPPGCATGIVECSCLEGTSDCTYDADGQVTAAYDAP